MSTTSVDTKLLIVIVFPLITGVAATPFTRTVAVNPVASAPNVTVYSKFPLVISESSAADKATL